MIDLLNFKVVINLIFVLQSFYLSSHSTFKKLNGGF